MHLRAQLASEMAVSTLLTLLYDVWHCYSFIVITGHVDMQIFRQLDVEGEGELDVVQLRKTLMNYPSEGTFTDVGSMVSAMKHCSLAPGK